MFRCLHLHLSQNPHPPVRMITTGSLPDGERPKTIRDVTESGPDHVISDLIKIRCYKQIAGTFCWHHYDQRVIFQAD